MQTVQKDLTPTPFLVRAQHQVLGLLPEPGNLDQAFRKKLSETPILPMNWLFLTQ